jgi:hypothetical protein
MANVRKRVDRQQSGKSRLVRIEEAFKGLLRTCAELPIAHRERFILVLLKQTCLPGGTACYVAWGEWNFSEIKDAFRSAGQISPALASLGTNGLGLCPTIVRLAGLKRGCAGSSSSW